MKTTTPSKTSTAGRNGKRPIKQRKLEVIAIKPYFPFIPPDQPEVYEIDDLLREALEWHETTTKKLDKAASAELRFYRNLEEAGLLGHDQVIVMDSESGDVVEPERIRGVIEQMEIDRAQRDMNKASEILIRHMLVGNAKAAKSLWEATAKHVTWLQTFCLNAPEMFHRHARLSDHLPVMATLAGGWEQKARDAISRIQLGAGLASSHLKPSACATESHVCRLWAARAIKTLDHNRHLEKQMDCVRQFLTANPAPHLTFASTPSWVMATKNLVPFSKATLQDWAALTRKMIADQVPAITERKEFKEIVSNIRGHLRKKFGEGKDTEGRVRNALLDKIISAMRSVLCDDT